MKIILSLLILSLFMFAEELCDVKVCNKIERITLNPLSVMGDKINETCFDITMPKNQVYVGAVLSSDSRWYQGNPTKKSVTKITKINYCR